MLPNQREDRPKRIWIRRWRLAGLLGSSVVWLAVLVGCQTSSSDKLDDTATRLQKLHTLLSVYLVEGKPVQGERTNETGRPNEEGLKAFVATLAPHRKETFGITDTQEIFVSPRDGQPFVINYDMPSSGHVLAIWEQTGTDGKRYVVYADGNVEEVDEETFSKIKPKK